MDSFVGKDGVRHGPYSCAKICEWYQNGTLDGSIELQRVPEVAHAKEVCQAIFIHRMRVFKKTSYRYH